MKKFLLAATSATVFTAGAQAGSLHVDLRADHNSGTYTDSNLNDYSKIYFKTGRLDYQNKIGEDLSYRLRLAFTKDGTATGKIDSAQTAVEYAYINHKMSDYFTLSVGKLNTDAGGFEGATSGADLYMLSQHYNLTGPYKSTTPSKNLGTLSILYMTGAKGIFTLGDHSISLLAANEPHASADYGADASQNSPLAAIVWRGAYMEKALMTNLSYHTVSGTTGKDRHQMMAAGLLFNAKPFSFQADYLMSEFKQDASSKKDTVTSIVAKFAYTGWEQWTPRLELQTSEEKLEIGGTAKNTFIGYGAVLEYKPYTDTNFRYHLAYNNTKEEFEATLNQKDAIGQEVILGARLLTDFMK